MERQAKSVDTAQLLESYRTLLQTADTLPLQVSGNSMAPFLVHGRDTVFLSRIDRPLRVGDIVLYQRTNGAYILHRICRLEGDTYCMAGDAQTLVEHGITREQIFAVVQAAERKGRRQEPGCFWWEFFEKIWVRMVPHRPVIQRLYGVLKKCFGRKPA